MTIIPGEDRETAFQSWHKKLEGVRWLVEMCEGQGSLNVVKPKVMGGYGSKHLRSQWRNLQIKQESTYFSAAVLTVYTGLPHQSLDSNFLNRVKADLIVWHLEDWGYPEPPIMIWVKTEEERDWLTWSRPLYIKKKTIYTSCKNKLNKMFISTDEH